MDMDEWQLEMDRMLGVFEHESESSLREINRRFEVLDRPFSDEFRKHFLKISTQRLEMSFTKVEIERWNNGQTKSTGNRSGSEQDRQHYGIMSSSSISASGREDAMSTGFSQMAEDNEILLEIIDLSDENDDIQPKKPAGSQNKNGTSINNDSSGFSRQKVDGFACSMVSRNVQSGFSLMNVPLVRCDSNQRNVQHLNASGNSSGGNLNGSVDADDFIESDRTESVAEKDENLKSIAQAKDEPDAVNKIEIILDEEEHIPLVRFDPNGKTNHFRTENDKSKRQQSGSAPNVHKCKHCPLAFHFKSKLNGKLTGTMADRNGIYHCNLCIRQFTNVAHLSNHMKSHKTNQYLYDCARCMRQFVREAEKDRHGSQCDGRHYECHLCKVYVTAKNSHMQCHMRKLSGARPFRCMVCSKSFQQKINLRKHLNSKYNHIDS